ncbi:MAG: chromate efflux transporter [Candidatus Obscuribacterales bacterium]|nr:chromate efflux transporter [Steroidobacteraceae bacterium]
MSEDSTALGAPVSFREALRFWAKLGFISFGGPAGQIAIMHRELVERRQWISEERFLHALNFCMLLPGPEAQQLAIYIGWMKHRVLGGVIAGVLFILPGFILITAISWMYVSFADSAPLQGVFFGLKAAVLAVVLEAVHRIGKRAIRNKLSWTVAAVSFLGIFAFAVPFPVIVLTAALLGLLLQWKRPEWLSHAGQITSDTTVTKTDETTASVSWQSSLRIAAVCLCLWFAPLILVYVLLGATHVLSLEGVFFSKMAVVTFGGAYAVLSYVAQQAVERYAWLSPNDMMQGLALAETTPGPLILVLTFVGFMAAYQSPAPFDPVLAGVFGAALTTWVTFVPCFLWILLGAPHVERLRHNKALSAALSVITAAIVGVILNLAVWFALHALFGEVNEMKWAALSLPLPQPRTVDVPAVAIAGVATLALLRFKAPMMATLAACALLGVVSRLV